MGTSKDSEAESAKEMSEELPVEGKAVGIAEDDEPLVSRNFPRTIKSLLVNSASH